MKVAAILLLVLLMGCVKEVRTVGKALLIVAPENFRDEEAFYTKEELEKAGIEVTVASTRKGICRGMLGGTIEAEKALTEVNVSEYDAIVFIGGSGIPTVRADPRAVEIAREAFKQGKIVGAICWAPTILAKAGILQGRRATVWYGNDPEYGKTTAEVLEMYGAKYTGEPLTVDGNIVTANGPGAARNFGRKIAELIGNK